MRKKRNRGRKDHYVPQGYLRGFIDPARENLDKPLWVFDLKANAWSEKSTTEIGWERGFYDYANAEIAAEHPDVTFAKFEREFPTVRQHMERRHYKGWVKQHSAFLLGYMQMMRARSPLFIQQQTAHNRDLRGATVTAVDGNRITVDSLELRPLPEPFIRNRTISNIREEIAKGPDWMCNFNWCLRYTNSVSEPFVAGPQPLVLVTTVLTTAAALTHPDTMIWFPLSWRACMIGSLRRFDEGTDKAHPDLIRHVRELFSQLESGYIVSPSRVEMPDLAARESLRRLT